MKKESLVEAYLDLMVRELGNLASITNHLAKGEVSAGALREVEMARVKELELRERSKKALGSTAGGSKGSFSIRRLRLMARLIWCITGNLITFARRSKFKETQ